MFACLVAVCMFSTTYGAEKPILESIVFKIDSQNREQVTFQLNHTCIPKIFAIKGKKPRVVFDFPKTGIARTMPNAINTDGVYVKKIRIGLHTGKKPKTRVVFDLSDAGKIDFRQQFNQENNSLTIVVFPAGSDVAASPVHKEHKEQKIQKIQKIQKMQRGRQMTQASVLPESAPLKAGRSDASRRKPVPATTAPVINRPESLPTSPDHAEIEKSVTRPTDKPVKEKNPIVSEPDNSTVNKPGKTRQEQPILQSVTFDNSSKRGEMIRFKLTDFNPPTVFGIEEGLPRVVCDFKNMRAGSKLTNIIHANGRYVKTIRIGLHKNQGKIRVVIDLEANNNYDLQQVFFKEENLFVIIVNTIHSTKPGVPMNNENTTMKE